MKLINLKRLHKKRLEEYKLILNDLSNVSFSVRQDIQLAIAENIITDLENSKYE